MHVNLYVARKERRLSQYNISKVIGIHKQTYYLKENGKKEFTLSEAKQLAEIFDTTVDELFSKSRR
ncbi:helix-turn-helix transcriptional regulator [Salicibibacter cibarius]|uniref:Helix-turn-helix transcriptional regulator n=2 Tax=Bacillaceae TaxID=186817 RepID=A0A7T6Z6M2_9BACI|nr:MULTISPECIES: helix-turn-helix transcriptional regulator [Bacillaceae]QQK77845.1 helix-turn-helix transcriptional regulator [Salicibibacter cibarius]SDI43731.1 putative transcriptional regulator [Natribacillus halophilus]